MCPVSPVFQGVEVHFSVGILVLTTLKNFLIPISELIFEDKSPKRDIGLASVEQFLVSRKGAGRWPEKSI
jgi:hypothetical protein